MNRYDRWWHASDEADAKVKSLKGKIRRRKKKLANIIDASARQMMEADIGSLKSKLRVAEYLRMELSLMAFGIPPENFSPPREQLQLEDHSEADR